MVRNKLVIKLVKTEVRIKNRRKFLGRGRSRAIIKRTDLRPLDLNPMKTLYRILKLTNSLKSSNYYNKEMKLSHTNHGAKLNTSFSCGLPTKYAGNNDKIVMSWSKMTGLRSQHFCLGEMISNVITDLLKNDIRL